MRLPVGLSRALEVSCKFPVILRPFHYRECLVDNQALSRAPTRRTTCVSDLVISVAMATYSNSATKPSNGSASRPMDSKDMQSNTGVRLRGRAATHSGHIINDGWKRWTAWARAGLRCMAIGSTLGPVRGTPRFHSFGAGRLTSHFGSDVASISTSMPISLKSVLTALSIALSRTPV